MPISLPEAEDEHEQKPEAKGRERGRTRSAQRLELENHNELYAYLVDARLGLFDL